MSDHAVLEAVRERSTSHASRIHGEAHWKSVAAADPQNHPLGCQCEGCL